MRSGVLATLRAEKVRILTHAAPPGWARDRANIDLMRSSVKANYFRRQGLDTISENQLGGQLSADRESCLRITARATVYGWPLPSARAIAGLRAPGLPPPGCETPRP